MNFLGQNLRYLRKQKELTQEQLASKIGVTRSLVGAYEESKAEPKLQTISNLCHYFQISLDDFLNVDLTTKSEGITPEKHIKGEYLRILPIVIDKNSEKEYSIIVPQKAAAGYSKGYGDLDYIQALPKFSMPYPELGGNKTLRLFQIQGDSMLPVPSGAYIICEYLSDWHSFKLNHTYIVVTKSEGIVYKRLLQPITDNGLWLYSDNKNFKPYKLPLGEIVEVWKALGYTSFNLPDNTVNSSDVLQLLHDLKDDVEYLKRKLHDK